jgi:hypothetical protein
VTSQFAKDNPTLRRPALAITYSTGPGAPPPPPAVYPIQLGALPRTWWVDPAGSDELNGGFPDSAFKSPAKAVFEAWPSDRIYLKSGVYPGVRRGAAGWHTCMQAGRGAGKDQRKGTPTRK